MDEIFFDEQALRLLRAFFRIKDQDARELLIQLAESAERGASIAGTVEGSALKPGAGHGKVIDRPAFRNSSNRN